MDLVSLAFIIQDLILGKEFDNWVHPTRPGCCDCRHVNLCGTICRGTYAWFSYEFHLDLLGNVLRHC